MAKSSLFLISGLFFLGGVQALETCAWGIAATPTEAAPVSPAVEAIQKLEDRRHLVALDRNALRNSDANVADWHLTLNKRAAVRAEILKNEFHLQWEPNVLETTEPEIFVWMVDRRFERAELHRTRFSQTAPRSEARARLQEIEAKLASLKATGAEPIRKYEEFRRKIESVLGQEFALWRSLPADQRPPFFRSCSVLLKLPRAARARATSP